MRYRSGSLTAIFGLLGAVLLASSCGSSANSATASNVNKEPAVVDVTTAAATIVPIPTYVEATGNLTSDAQTP